MEQTDVDKKIAEWEELRLDPTGKLGKMSQNGELITEFFIAVNQLKTCREELADWRAFAHRLESFCSSLRR